MDFELPEEYRMLQETVRRFVRQELMPLETTVLERDTQGMTGEDLVPPEAEERLLAVAREAGLWGLDVPEEFGGLNLGALPKCLATEELYKTITPFTFPPDAPNLHMLMQTCTPEQREKYLLPYAQGKAHSAIAISEPGAGSDPAGMQTSAVKKGDPVGNQRAENLDITRPCRRLHYCHGGDGKGQRRAWRDYGLSGG